MSKIKTTLSYSDGEPNRRYNRFIVEKITLKISIEEKKHYKQEEIYMRGVLYRMKT